MTTPVGPSAVTAVPAAPSDVALEHFAFMDLDDQPTLALDAGEGLHLEHLAKGRRADGRAALVELAQRMERYYTERSTYATATLGNSGIYPSTSPQGFYTLSITAKSATAFSIQATPTGSQLHDACGSLGYNQSGDKSSSGGTLPTSACW